MTCIERLRRAVCDDDPKYVNLHFTRHEFDSLTEQVARNERWNAANADDEFCKKWRCDSWATDYPDTVSAVFWIRVFNLTGQERLDMARDLIQSGVVVNPICKRVAVLICAGEF